MAEPTAAKYPGYMSSIRWVKGKIRLNPDVIKNGTNLRAFADELNSSRLILSETSDNTPHFIMAFLLQISRDNLKIDNWDINGNMKGLQGNDAPERILGFTGKSRNLFLLYYSIEGEAPSSSSNFNQTPSGNHI